MNKHPGFKSVQKKIEKEGYSKEAAGAILASRTRKASKKAKAKNPRLKRVKGKAHKKNGPKRHRSMKAMERRMANVPV